MKTIILSMAITAALFAQANKDEVCYRKTVDGKASESCIVLSPAVKAAMASFLETQETQVEPPVRDLTKFEPKFTVAAIPKYRGPAHLVLEHVLTLCDTLLEQYPGTTEKAARDAATESMAKAKAARAEALPVLPSKEPE